MCKDPSAVWHIVNAQSVLVIRTIIMQMSLLGVYLEFKYSSIGMAFTERSILL